VIWLKSLLIFSMLICYFSYAWTAISFFEEKKERYSFTHTFLKILSVTFWSYSLYLGVYDDSITPAFYIFGTIGNLISFSIFWWAMRTTYKHGFSAIYGRDIPESLVIEGPYKYVRNPIYSAYLLGYLVNSITFLSAYLLVLFILLLLFYLFAIRMEENKFTWSDDFLEFTEYKKRTGQIIPKLRFKK
jgi:protein-S-isoprenylcysteine O-methyltransferase Ste14